MSQLLIPFELQETKKFDLFFGIEQEWMVAALKDWVNRDIDSAPFCWIWGGGGVGKSHLLSAVGYELLNKGRVFYLDLSNIASYEPDIMSNLSSSYVICIDNVDAVVSNHAWEKALFSLYNDAVMMLNCKLIVTASMPSKHLGFSLPDLRSRMSQGLELEVKKLSVENLAKAIIFRAKFLGFELSSSVVNYLMIHFSSCSKCLFGYLDLLKDFSWQNKRKITIPLVKNVADSLVKCNRCVGGFE